MVKQDLDFSEEVRVSEGLIGDACLSVAWWRFDNQLVGVCNERSGASGELGCANEGSRPAPSRQCYTCLHCRRLHHGIAAIWLYAAARPRFGAGPKTAGLTGFTYWIMGYALPTLGQIPVGLFPKRLSVCGQRCRRLVLEGMILRLQRYLHQDAPT